MGSWKYAFYFPSPQSRLAPAKAIGVFSEYQLVFDEFIRPAIVIDNEGHLDFGEEVLLSDNKLDELRRRLEDGEQFQIECRNRDLSFSCSFATRYVNSYVMIGWSRRLYDSLHPHRQDQYLEMLRKIGGRSDAAYMAIVIDPADFFEDQFLDKNGTPKFDPVLSDGLDRGIESVWINDLWR